MVAEVIVDVAISEVDRVFDYKIDCDNVFVGSRVVVPFGRTFKSGIVVDIKQTSDYPEDKLKHVLRPVEDTPALTEECMQIAKAIVKRYHVPMALSLRLFLPAEMRTGKVREKNRNVVTLAQNCDKDKILSELKKNAVKQIALLSFMEEGKKYLLSDLNKTYGSQAVKALEEKGCFIINEERINRSPYIGLDENFKQVNLSAEQNEAIESILKSDKTVQLLHGVTGSGKTEVYLNLIKRTVNSGKTALMLVPEIALTPQMLSQLRARFSSAVAILHSGLSAGEKFDEWWRIRSGEAKVAVGARSAVFAPLENLGLIIIDEEHDGSYESETNPRYSTADIAKYRAAYNGCKLILGSATPKVESYLLAKEGKYNLVEMKNRINGKQLPEIIIADMKRELRRGNYMEFSRALIDEMTECLNSGNQAMIFLNRRGYSQQIICKDCGYVPKCKECDVSLNYHSVGNVLKCHYCNTTYNMLSACPECGSTNIGFMGTGTQKVVTRLNELFPKARILRMDNDTTQNKDGHFKILKKFSSHEADILVGTQMIAKGHDFPAVTLVGILDADMSLYFSDYRSGERTFQLITQVSGRSGRADKKGKVVLQTYSPENSILQYAVRYDYVGFFNKECSVRKMTNFPPFALIVRVMVESGDDELALEKLKEVYLNIKEIYDNNKQAFLFFNKMRSPIKRIKNKYRYQVLMRLKCGNGKILDEIYTVAENAKDNKTLVYVEENPGSMS